MHAFLAWEMHSFFSAFSHKNNIRGPPEETLEDMVIRQIELEMLQKAMQSLTEVQKERLHLYFFEGLTYRQIGEKLRISDMSVRESIEASLKKIKKFFN